MNDENNSSSLSGITINYNSVDWSYLGDAYDGFNVIDLQAVAPDETEGTLNANTGLAYDRNNNYIIVACTPSSQLGTRVYDRNYNLIEEIPNISTQGIAYDPVNLRYYQLTTGGLVAKDSLNNVLFTLLFSSTQPNPGMVYYSPAIDKFFCSYDGNGSIFIWTPDYDANTLSLYDTISGIGAEEGVCYNDNTGEIWINAVNAKKKYDLNGNLLKSFPFTLSAGTVNEGLAIDPTDKTLWFNSDEYYHGSVIGGNRLWHIDPDKTYNKNIDIPNQIKWEWGTLQNVTVVNNQLIKIDSSQEGSWISPVFDMNEYTDIQLEENFSTQPSEILTSSTAPTELAIDKFPFDYYSGWGDTVPSSVELTGILRYVQFKFNI
ncbi:MAG: hypothetical protein ACOWWH_12725 [Eubacteriaceae bacterium]